MIPLYYRLTDAILFVTCARAQAAVEMPRFRPYGVKRGGDGEDLEMSKIFDDLATRWQEA